MRREPAYSLSPRPSRPEESPPRVPDRPCARVIVTGAAVFDCDRGAHGRGPERTRACTRCSRSAARLGRGCSGNEAAGVERSPDQLRPAGPRKTLPRRRFFLRAPLFSTAVGAFLTGRSFSVRAIAQKRRSAVTMRAGCQGGEWQPLHRGRASAPEDERPAATPSSRSAS